MNTVEQEIIEKFNQLQPDAQQRVLARIGRSADAQTHSASKFDFAAWWPGRIRPLHDHRIFVGTQYIAPNFYPSR